MRRKLGVSVLAVVLTSYGCRVGPRYQRPAVDVPAAYRSDSLAFDPSESLGAAKWWEVFSDTVLQRLIATALNENYDVSIAATRILQARAQLGIVRADQFPTATGGVEASRQKTPAAILGTLAIPSVTYNIFRVDATLSWELDFWDKLRSATEAQRANLLGAHW